MIGALVLLGLATLAAGKPALSLVGDNVRVELFARYSREPTDAFATACPNERVYNVFIDEPFNGQPLCEWAAAQVDNSNPRTWTNVGGENVELDVEAFVAELYGAECRAELAERAAELIRINGAAPLQPVRVNVIEASADDALTAETFADWGMAYRYPSACAADGTDERVVINFIIASWCDSGCLSARDEAPRCFGDAGCDEAHGQCVADNTCFCADGYAGPRCATRVGCETDGCSQRGVCNAQTGQCQCTDGFSGERCQFGSAPGSGTSAGGTTSPTAAPTVAPHGDEIEIDQSWLNPFTAFPNGNFSHFGQLSYTQIPWRANWQQTGRSQVELPRPTDDQVEGQGYVVARVDYEKREIYYEIAYTVPRKSIATGPSTPTATLHRGALGYTGDQVAALDEGYWCVIPSWVSLGWEAWKRNGTLSFDAALVDELAGSLTYVQLSTADRPHGVLRAQLIRFDTALAVQLSSPSTAADTQGAGLFFLDERSASAQFWVLYTAPRDYIELGGTINTAADDVNVHPLPVGEIGLRRIGFYDRSNVENPAQIVCAVSKFGIWRFDGDVYGANPSAVANSLRAGGFTINIASNDNRDGALTGVISA